MSAYNVEKYIAESINSILRQSFRDFELIIVNDGSTDRTQSVIDSFDDKRLIKIVNPRHDFIESLNTGMATAKGKYVARMDADDIMHVDRLRIQHALMEENPEITVCTSWLTPFGEGIAKGAPTERERESSTVLCYDCWNVTYSSTPPRSCVGSLSDTSG